MRPASARVLSGASIASTASMFSAMNRSTEASSPSTSSGASASQVFSVSTEVLHVTRGTTYAPRRAIARTQAS